MKSRFRFFKPLALPFFGLFFGSLLHYSSASAQVEYDFKPMKLHSDRSRELIRQVDSQLSSETIDAGTLRSNIWIQGIKSERAALLKRMIKSESFIDNDTLEQFAYDFLQRIVTANNLPVKDRKVLIINSPDANAFCYGPGLFFVTVGLLGKVTSEEELAFIFSHEIAHDELHHIEQKLMREAYKHFSRNKEATFKSILSDREPEQALVSARTAMYNRSTFSRECELQADSLGLVLLTNTGYSAEGAIKAMNTLQAAAEPKHTTSDFFQPLDFSKFPFKDRWLNDRLTVYNHRPGDTYFFSYDSLLSHPDLALRKVAVQQLINESGLDANEIQFRDQLKLIIPLAEFQTVEAAYQTNRYDWSLFQILQLQKLYPGNSYLVSREAKLMVDLFEAKNENKMSDYAARYTTYYGEQLKEVNNFLFNLSKEEAIEVAFHIINNQSNFNKDDRSHYFLLWQICIITERENVRARIEAAYSTRFGKKVDSYDYR